MKRALPILAFLSFVAGPLCAQTITFRDGKNVQGTDLKRSGDTVISTITVGTGKGTVIYPLSSIARIDFSEAPEIGAARSLLVEGKATEAIAKIEPVLAAQAPFRSVAGNRWPDAAGVKLMALIALRKDAAAAALAKDVQDSNSPDKSAAELAQASILARKGKAGEAIKLAKPIIDKAESRDVLAAAWICVGDSELALRNNEAALEAYLHVPVFYPKEALWMPSALLGSARAFEALDDLSRARDSLVQLRDKYSSSPDAALSEKDLKRIEHKLKTQAAEASN